MERAINSRSARIRRARPADADALTEIAHGAKRHWGYPESLMHLWKADLSVTPQFVDTHAVYLATDAADASRIVGFYALSREGEAFELEHMWVDPPHMGVGLGAALFAHAIATVRSLGGATLSIASDPNAEGFYRRMGARLAGTVPSRPEGRALPMLVFDLRLPTPPPEKESP